MRYIYVVNSRRAGGLSLGINLNTNNACNWRCIYCQVDGLQRGIAPTIQLDVLENELHTVIEEIQNGIFFSYNNIPLEFRTIRDISISGNGEPTTCRELEQVIGVIEQALKKYSLPDHVKVVLITNGSLMDKRSVQKSIKRIAGLKGEIWFKLDSATEQGIKIINNAQLTVSRARKNLQTAAILCSVWLQTCVFRMNGQSPSGAEQKAYLDFLTSVLNDNTQLKGILLYGIARLSMQKESATLQRLEPGWLEIYAQKIRSETGLDVITFP